MCGFSSSFTFDHPIFIYKTVWSVIWWVIKIARWMKNEAKSWTEQNHKQIKKLFSLQWNQIISSYEMDQQKCYKGLSDNIFLRGISHRIGWISTINFTLTPAGNCYFRTSTGKAASITCNSYYFLAKGPGDRAHFIFWLWYMVPPEDLLAIPFFHGSFQIFSVRRTLL